MLFVLLLSGKVLFSLVSMCSIEEKKLGYNWYFQYTILIIYRLRFDLIADDFFLFSNLFKCIIIFIKILDCKGFF